MIYTILDILFWYLVGTGLLLAASIGSWRMQWAMFIPKTHLPLILLLKHTDYPKGFQWIPRRWTAFLTDKGEPIKLLGNNPKGHHLDVPAAGTWVIAWPFCFAYTTHKGGKLRLPGIRYDYIDNYYDLTARFALWD